MKIETKYNEASLADYFDIETALKDLEATEGKAIEPNTAKIITIQYQKIDT